jgi:hypothetical protein
VVLPRVPILETDASERPIKIADQPAQHIFCAKLPAFHLFWSSQLIMSGARTRKQTAMAAKEAHTGSKNGAAILGDSGNGSAHGPSDVDTGDDYPRENIFLFWPNLIGMHFYPATTSKCLWCFRC